MTMPSSRLEISAEWALWGKEARDAEYRLLRCSDGVFGPPDFIRAIDRYSPGTLDARSLPQVTVSWLREPFGHLCLAIHETAADDDPRHGLVRSRFDAAGREIVYVRFFCVRYDDLADRAVDYRQLYNALSRCEIPERGGAPVTARLAFDEGTPPTASENRFAQHVAAQLLTKRPVCVLGASGMPLAERLRFLDLVMSWLPYGARSQLSAATMVNSNFTGHWHRLFFASAPRDEPAQIEDPADAGRRPGRLPDVVVEWGHVDASRVTDPEAREYLGWEGLDQDWGPFVLARDTKPFNLGNKDEIREIIRRVRLGGIGKLTVPDTLALLGGELRTGTGRGANLPGYLGNLTAKGRHLSGEEREKCWRLARRDDLLAERPGAGDDYYDGLLGALLDGPVTYRDFLRLANSTNSPLLHAPLLNALMRRMTGEARTTAGDVPWLLVRRGLGDTNADLVQALAQGSVPPDKLAGRLVDDAILGIDSGGRNVASADGGPLLRPEHGRALFDPAVQYLLKYGRGGRAEIARLGYMGPALYRYYADDEKAQVGRAVAILKASYGERLDKVDIKEVFGGSPHKPVDALLAAVIRLAPADLEEFAMTEYGRARTPALASAPARQDRAPARQGSRPERRRGIRLPWLMARSGPQPEGQPAGQPGGQPEQSSGPSPQAVVLFLLLFVLVAIVAYIVVTLTIWRGPH
ncbi:MAG: hypothetical protein J2P25_19870 [Nocardiopsaceae bacterium]|nr:hypothetical protein [Nocardiopsaceae bacterium]